MTQEPSGQSPGGVVFQVHNPCVTCLRVTGEERGRYPRRYAQAVERESGHWIKAERCPYWENTWHLKFPPGWTQLVAVQVAQALARSSAPEAE